MRNKILQRRLDAIEAKSNQVIEAQERQRMSITKREISAEQAERTYKKLIVRPKITHSKGLSNPSDNQLVAFHLKEIMKPAPRHRGHALRVER